jgi:predicted NBD/HSP70 family sugar kinase
MIDRISDLIEGFKKDFNVKFVAIASAGTINENGFCLYAYNLPFTCVDIKQRVESIINIPVYVANDMYCAALGEKNFGALKSVNEFVIIGLGTGLGFKKFNFN